MVALFVLVVLFCTWLILLIEYLGTRNVGRIKVQKSKRKSSASRSKRKT